MFYTNRVTFAYRGQELVRDMRSLTFFFSFNIDIHFEKMLRWKNRRSGTKTIHNWISKCASSCTRIGSKKKVHFSSACLPNCLETWPYYPSMYFKMNIWESLLFWDKNTYVFITTRILPNFLCHIIKYTVRFVTVSCLFSIRKSPTLVVDKCNELSRLPVHQKVRRPTRGAADAQWCRL